jgi:hypothetical protein
MSVSGEGITFWWGIKHIVLEEEYFKWKGVPLRIFGNPYF